MRGASPSNDGTDLDGTERAPEGAPTTIAGERCEEFAPGLDPDLLELVQATADRGMELVVTCGPLT